MLPHCRATKTISRIILWLAIALAGFVMRSAAQWSNAKPSRANSKADQQSLGESLSIGTAQISVDNAPRAAVLELLQQAITARVELSRDEVRQLADFQATVHGYTVKDINRLLKSCNNDKYEMRSSGALWETAETMCSGLGLAIAPEFGMIRNLQGLGASSPAAEAAFARSCALPIVGEVREVADGCVDLSRLFERRRDLDWALAVVQYAPKCQGKLHAEAEIHPIDPDQPIDSANSQLESCLIQEAQLLREMHRPQEERSVDTTLCNAAEETGCSFLAELGADVNMKAVEERQASLQAAAQSRADADSAARAQARTERDANFQNLINTVHSVPGGADPNAIVNTANQQAANMIALGAANDAARREAAEQRREQAAVKQVQANAQQIAQEVANGTLTPQQAMQQIQQQAQQTAQQQSASGGPQSQAESPCAGFPAFITASSSAFSQVQFGGNTAYSGSLTFNIPPGYHGDGAEIDNMAQGTSFAAGSGTVITIDTVSGPAHPTAFFILANATNQMTYLASFPTNVPAPFSITLKRDDQRGCGQGSATGGAGVPE